MEKTKTLKKIGHPFSVWTESFVMLTDVCRVPRQILNKYLLNI